MLQGPPFLEVLAPAALHLIDQFGPHQTDASLQNSKENVSETHTLQGRHETENFSLPAATVEMLEPLAPL